MDNPQPEVFVSLIICRDILFDTTGLPTALGITNQINARVMALGNLRISGGDAPSQQFDEIIPTTVFGQVDIGILAAFYCEADREVDISVRLRKPDGSFAASDTNPVRRALVNSGENGKMFSIKTQLDTSNPGLYWFEVYIDDTMRTKSPLMIRHAESNQPAPSAGLPSDDVGDHRQNL